ncbi:OLC1v1002931C1 [Oldenlandia corymbosa var. corymbosa]|uniref:OLC1v1002931C1 n=1 Tax=Oldenlandia corymbosa var. corymbosa TaxID=529605 RepID=A0AAV1D8W2_OLDCO|nr:OLC1v1002931C1 [Oldenlandia corymbosa var. corymbosa]
MSCNGCRILRKGCNENCILRQSLQGIESPQAQANATVFVAKFFGRAGLMSFLSAVPESQRPALFQSLLYEACGRTVNPVSGVVGLLWTGNWHLCQSAVETVLRGGRLRPVTEDLPNNNKSPPLDDPDDDALMMDSSTLEDEEGGNRRRMTSNLVSRMTAGGRVKRRSVTPDESETTTMESRFYSDHYNSFPNSTAGGEADTKLLRLFF